MCQASPEEVAHEFRVLHNVKTFAAEANFGFFRAVVKADQFCNQCCFSQEVVVFVGGSDEGTDARVSVHPDLKVQLNFLVKDLGGGENILELLDHLVSSLNHSSGLIFNLGRISNAERICLLTVEARNDVLAAKVPGLEDFVSNAKGVKALVKAVEEGASLAVSLFVQ